VVGSLKSVPSVVFLSARKGSCGGVDIQSGGTAGSGEGSKGAGVREEVEERFWAKGAEGDAVFTLIRKQSWRSTRGQINAVREAEFLDLRLPTGSEHVNGGIFAFDLPDDPLGFP
jgi:hypothetical protein